MHQIYLDYNATTPIAPSVQQAMQPFLADHYGNPSSGHVLGRAAAEAVEDARGYLAILLGCDRDEILFTSGGTESDNMALKGLMMSAAPSSAGHLVISAIEHPAISETAAFLERLGYGVTVVGCNADGVVQPEAVERALRLDTVLVSIMHANNETGVVQPIREIAAVCHANEVLMHTDAAQTVGKIPVQVDELGVDLLTVAGHKMYAPKGVGALYVRRGVAIEPLMHGGGHEGGLRAGTENTASIAGLGKAAQLCAENLDAAGVRMAELRDELLQLLVDAIGEDVQLNGAGAERLPNTLNVNLMGVNAQDLLARVPELCASTGSACHAGATAMSPVQAAMGLTPAQARSTLRLSTGWYTSVDEVRRAANLITGAYESLRG